MKTNPFPLLLSAIIFAISLGAVAQEKVASPPIYVKASDTKELMSKDGAKSYRLRHHQRFRKVGQRNEFCEFRWS